MSEREIKVSDSTQLKYRPTDYYSPIPPSEQGLQTVTAEYFYQVYSENGFLPLEGLCFDRKRDLYFTDVQRSRILKIDMETKELHTIYQIDPKLDLLAAAVKIHKDGRLFVCCAARQGRSLLKPHNNGCILAMNPDGSNCQIILEGYNADDMVFDQKGGFYFNDYVGTVFQPVGGTYYVDSQFKTVKLIVPNLASPNGLCLTKDGSALWITEMATGFLHRYVIETGISSIYYHFTGAQGPDSCSIDDDDNVYVALYRQGRVMVFNKYGNPIGQVLLPNRDQGHNLASTHPMVCPGTRELFICSCDDVGREGSWIFRAGSFGKGYDGAYQFK